MKMNALEDADITRALYQASQAGVKVDLIVRDTCRLRPGLPGLSENVTIISIVGRFLEHARIFYFRNGGNEEYYIGSADCMKRNLESRVEVVAPVEKPALRAELRYLLDTQLTDQRSAWDDAVRRQLRAAPPAQGQAQEHQGLPSDLHRARREAPARGLTPQAPSAQGRPAPPPAPLSARATLSARAARQRRRAAICARIHRVLASFSGESWWRTSVLLSNLLFMSKNG